MGVYRSLSRPFPRSGLRVAASARLASRSTMRCTASRWEVSCFGAFMVALPRCKRSLMLRGVPRWVRAFRRFSCDGKVAECAVFQMCEVYVCPVFFIYSSYYSYFPIDFSEAFL